jgi:hypothetical protein
MPPSNSDRIAICGELVPRFLKHRLLFFDRIGLEALEDTVKLLRALESDALRNIANELEFLQSRNIVFDAAPFVLEAKAFYHQSEEIPPEEKADLLSAQSIERWVNDLIERRLLAGKDFGIVRAARLINGYSQFTARVCARHMQRFGRQEASAVLSEPLMIPRKMKRVYDKFQRPSTDVIEVVLDKLPMPPEDTPWEQILDFKADEEAQGYLRGLRVWMGEITRQKLTAIPKPVKSSIGFSSNIRNIWRCISCLFAGALLARHLSLRRKS